jgi:hypothetical protein
MKQASQTETEKRIEILENRIRAAEAAWNWCRANGRKASAASRQASLAMAELKRISK